MITSASLRLCASAFLGLAVAARAAVDPDTRVLIVNPAIERAADRAAARAAARGASITTNRMTAVVRVASQSVMAGQLVSRMTDGSTVVAPLKRATTARVPEALARLRIDRALARIAVAVEADPKAADKRAAALEKLAEQIEKQTGGVKPPGKPVGSGRGILLAVATAAAAGAAARSMKRKYA